jgi:hypothetical protein
VKPPRREGHEAAPARHHEEVTQATRRLVEVLDVVSVSHPYPDRGTSVLVRVYLEVRLPQAAPAPAMPNPADVPPHGQVAG